MISLYNPVSSSFFYTDTSTTQIYTLSLHDALPIYKGADIQFDSKGIDFGPWLRRFTAQVKRNWFVPQVAEIDRKSTRLNSSHPSISYAVFCLKKKIPSV